jgi:hypothetical protein
VRKRKNQIALPLHKLSRPTMIDPRANKRGYDQMLRDLHQSCPIRIGDLWHGNSQIYCNRQLLSLKSQMARSTNNRPAVRFSNIGTPQFIGVLLNLVPIGSRFVLLAYTSQLFSRPLRCEDTSP